MTKVVNCRNASYDIYIGRPSKWGNPFTISSRCSREQAIQCYKEWILSQPWLTEGLHEIKGKTLGCWCKPQACHGDYLAELADAS